MEILIAILLLLILAALVFPRATRVGCSAVLVLVGLVVLAIIFRDRC